MILVESNSNQSINPIAGPSIPRSFLTSTTNTTNQSTTTTTTTTTTPSDFTSPLYHFGHSQHQHQASNESQQQINQNHSSSITKRNPNKTKTQIRHADHLLDTPGVCFASWLSHHSSHLGTVRSTSIINRSLSSSSSSTSSSSTSSTSTSSSLTLSSSKHLNHQSSSTQITTSSSTSSPKPTLTQVENNLSTPETTNISNHQSSLTSSPSPPSPSIQSSKTSTQVNTNPTPAKPKSWADLLRTGPSKSNQTALPSNSNSSDQTKPTNTTTNNFQSSAQSLQSDMNDLLKSSSTLLSERLQTIKNSKQVPFIIPRGLINNGNICFANAILQVLVYCVPFYNLLKHLSLYTSHDFKSQTPLLDAMIGFINEFESIPSSELEPIKDPKTPNVLKYHLPNHLKKVGEPFIAESVWIATKGNSRFDAMRGGQQEDAQEFLCFFLDTLHEELLIAIERHDEPIRLRQQSAGAATNTTTKDGLLKVPANESDQPASSSDGWMEVGSKGRPSVTRSTDSITSPLTSIFGFNTRSILHKPKQKDSVTFEPNNMLQLSIESPNIKTIEEALLNFSTPEIISDMMTKNGSKSLATKQIFIESFPPVFILHLKRFGYHEGEVMKNSKKIKFGNVLKIPGSVRGPGQRNEKEISYKLFAVVYHHGLMASGGHYTVSIKQQVSDEWIYFDDTIIKDHNLKFPNEDFNQDSKTPYLLFYTRSS